MPTTTSIPAERSYDPIHKASAVAGFRTMARSGGSTVRKPPACRGFPHSRFAGAAYWTETVTAAGLPTPLPRRRCRSPHARLEPAQQRAPDPGLGEQRDAVARALGAQRAGAARAVEHPLGAGGLAFVGHEQ